MPGTKPTSQRSFVSLIDASGADCARPSDPPDQGAGRRGTPRHGQSLRGTVRGGRPPVDSSRGGCSRPRSMPGPCLRSTATGSCAPPAPDPTLCSAGSLTWGWTRPVFDPSTFSQNQERLLRHEVADLFFAEVVALAKKHGWVSNDHFSVDGTLVQAWASVQASKPGLRAKDLAGAIPGPTSGAEQRSNETHESAPPTRRQADPEGSRPRRRALVLRPAMRRWKTATGCA